jgi:hypothetical protein
LLAAAFAFVLALTLIPPHLLFAEHAPSHVVLR